MFRFSEYLLQSQFFLSVHLFVILLKYVSVYLFILCLLDSFLTCQLLLSYGQFVLVNFYFTKFRQMCFFSERDQYWRKRWHRKVKSIILWLKISIIFPFLSFALPLSFIHTNPFSLFDVLFYFLPFLYKWMWAYTINKN